jgi:hypothetical protein
MSPAGFTSENSPFSSFAERACQYLIDKVKLSSGRLFDQGRRDPPLACRASSPALRFVAERRLYRIPVSVARALVAWGDGFPVEMLEEIPPSGHVLTLQARGRRCVSLLPDGVPTFPHVDALAFALHDLCHLDKFLDPEHHLGQVGFFDAVERATRRHEWPSFVGDLDDMFRADFDHVVADMNGSAVFLFAALKMKLKMAARRAFARDRGIEAPTGGSLLEDESRDYERRLGELLRLLDFDASMSAAARQTSARRDDPSAALALLRHFEERGRQALEQNRESLC